MVRYGRWGTCSTGEDIVLLGHMSGGTRHSSAVSLGGHRTLGDGQHSDNVMSKNRIGSSSILLLTIHRKIAPDIACKIKRLDFAAVVE